MENEIERTFLEWTVEEVVQWLQKLSLSQDYSDHFKDHGIDGSSLLKLNPAALDELAITEGGDRVKLLQQITTMRADLIPSRSISPVKRVHSPLKMRRYSEIPQPSQNRYHGRLMRQAMSSITLENSLPPVARRQVPVGASGPPEKIQGEAVPGVEQSGSANSLNSHLSSVGLTNSGSPGSSRIGSPTKSRSSASPHHFLEGGSGSGGSKERGLEELCEDIQDNPTKRNHNAKRLSRSLDGLYLDGDQDVFSSVASEPAVEYRDSYNTRLVDILREENLTLKKELESYYNRVRKLQKLEREMERIREAHRLLEASASRRNKLEATMRDKLEQEIRKLKEDNIQQKAELKACTRKEGGTAGNDATKGKSREIRRRDTMIMKLIKKNKDAAAVREQLEKDLETAKAQLEAKRATESTEHDDQESGGDFTAKKSITEIETNIALVYSESIEKLKGVLLAMQNASHKREKLEKKLREQLQSEISKLKGGAGRKNSIGYKDSTADLQQKVVQLEADVAKWEHKCLELVAEKQMALETAVVPRDTRLAHLERSLVEKTDIVHELHQQRSMYLSQISDANQRLAEMEATIMSLQSTVAGKDSLIQMLQQSFLDPDDYSLCSSQEDQMSASQLHHSPVSAKKFSLNGHIGGGLNNSRGPGGHYDQLSLQIPSPSLPSFHHRLANGAHAHGSRPSSLRYTDSSLRGYQGEMSSPVRGYVNCSLPSSPVKAMQYERGGSLSPTKRPTERGTHKYYTLEVPDDVTDGSPTYYRGPVTNLGGGVGGGVSGGGGVYASHGSSTTHKLSLPTMSNSAPNSPSLRKISHHKPHISQPSLNHVHQQQPGSGGSPAAAASNGSSRTTKREQSLSNLTRLGSPPKYRNPKGRHPNMGDAKRDHIHPPTDMKGKSKTPPPNYKLDLHRQSARVGGVGSQGGPRDKSENGSPRHHRGQKRSSHTHKQRHHSVDDVLNGSHDMVGLGEAAAGPGLNLSMNSNSSGTLALFESLLGESLPKGMIGRGGAGRRRHVNSHRHSKSSPTQELIHL